MVRASVERHPDVEAVVEVGGERVTYAELWDRAARVAGGLVADGITRGDRVASLLPAGLDWVVGFLGTLLAGAVAVPGEHPLRRAGDRARPHRLRGRRGAAAPGRRCPTGNPEALDDLVPGDLAAIFYTSGTTGRPKGALHHPRQLPVQRRDRDPRHRHRPRRRADAAQPRLGPAVPRHRLQLASCSSSSALGGTTVVLPAFEADAFLRTIVEERIDTLVTVPAIYGLTLARGDLDVDLSRRPPRRPTAARPIAPDLVRRLQERLPQARLGNGFGLTETSSISTFLPHEWAVEHADSVGFAAPVVDLALADVDDAGVGELLIRGPNVVDGYWAGPGGDGPDVRRRLAAQRRPRPRRRRAGPGGRPRQGRDQPRRRERLLGRGRERPRRRARGGRRGRRRGPGRRHGREGRRGAGAAGSVDVDAVLAYLDTQLADFKVPQYVVVTTDPLPRNPGGKLLKRTLRDGTDWGRPVRGR